MTALEKMLTRELTKFAEQIVKLVSETAEQPTKPRHYIADDLRAAAEIGRKR